MKKILLVLLTVFPIVLVGCNSPKRERKDQDIDPTDPVDGDIELPMLILNKLNSYSSYKSVTSGQTVSNFIGIKVSQSIGVTFLKGEYSYLINESHSSVVNTVHTAYYHGDNALYKDDKADYSLSSIDDYLDIYGTYPMDAAIEGYIISKESVVNASQEQDGENLKIKLEFDKETSTNNVKIQMKKFGGLNDYPKFKENTTMEIITKADYTPVSLTLKAHYSAKKVIETDCKQEYTVTYSNYGETLEIPKLDEIKPLFNR